MTDGVLRREPATTAWDLWLYGPGSGGSPRTTNTLLASIAVEEPERNRIGLVITPVVRESSGTAKI